MPGPVRGIQDGDSASVVAAGRDQAHAVTVALQAEAVAVVFDLL
jgi:hypothetical protein